MPYTHEGLIGVARWPSDGVAMQHDAAQQAYGRSFWQATRGAGQAIAEGRISTLSDLWAHAAD